MKSGVDHKQLTTYAKGLRQEGLKGHKDRLVAAMRALLWQITGRAQSKYLTGGHPLNVRNDRLRSSVMPGRIVSGGGLISGTVGSNVFYGRVWEFGAQTPGHIVRPVNIDPRTGKVFTRLRFRLGPYGAHGEAEGQWVSPKQVVLAPKPWLAPAVEDSTSFALAAFGKASMQSAKGGKGGKKK